MRNRHADPFRPRLSDWLGESWKLILLAAFFVVVVGVAVHNSSTPPTRIKANIVGFSRYPYQSGYLPMAEVRLSDGTIRQVEAGRLEERTCKVGQSVTILQNGLSLKLPFRACI